MGAPSVDEEAARAWEVFGPDGRWVARLSAPRLEIMEIGEGYVAGVYRDEADVEYVRVHALTRGRDSGRAAGSPGTDDGERSATADW